MLWPIAVGNLARPLFHSSRDRSLMSRQCRQQAARAVSPHWKARALTSLSKLIMKLFSRRIWNQRRNARAKSNRIRSTQFVSPSLWTISRSPLTTMMILSILWTRHRTLSMRTLWVSRSNGSSAVKQLVKNHSWWRILKSWTNNNSQRWSATDTGSKTSKKASLRRPAPAKRRSM